MISLFTPTDVNLAKVVICNDNIYFAHSQFQKKQQQQQQKTIISEYHL